VAPCFLLACTRTANVAPSEWDELKPERNRHLVVTTAGARYQVEKYSMTDSTLVIEKVVPSPGTYPARDEGFDQPPSLPLVIPLDQIQSLEEVRRTSSALVGFLLVAGLGALMLIAMHIVSGTDFHPD
jgi:hypothetical protein